MRRRSFPLLALAISCCCVLPASAQNSLEFVGEFTIMGIADNGSAATGLSTDGIYETMRWTPDAGLVRLGMSSGAVLGRGGGHAEISADGLRVASSIVTFDSLYVTAGRWTKGPGWEEVLPPLPPTGGLIDESYGSVWGLSGDGETVVGLFHRPGYQYETAHAFAWTAAGGPVDLGSQGRDSRANGCNHDGSVVVGWSADSTGAWQPTVWEDGTMTILSATIVGCEAEGTSPDGDIIVGRDFNDATQLREATVWLRDGDGWQGQFLGTLPGTYVGFGWSGALAVNFNGSIIVGYNAYSLQNREGFVWTLDGGLMKAADYLTGLGLTLPTDFTIQSMTDISDDGRWLCGYGYYGTLIGIRHSFIVHVPDISAVPEAGRSVALEPNYPNPFNPSTTIALSTAAAGPARVEVFDARGHLVRVIHDGPLSAGRHELSWNGRDGANRAAASGVYLVRARLQDGTTAARRMTLAK